MRSAKACSTTLEGVDVECTHCGVRMTTSTGGGGTIRYFHCPGCNRWGSSMYTEMFRVDAKMRPCSAAEGPSAFGQVKDRLQQWLRGLEVGDPYRVLNVSPRASDEAVRQRYLALARAHHPDRGGDAAAMRRLNQAYEQVQKLRAGQSLAAHAGALPTGA